MRRLRCPLLSASLPGLWSPCVPSSLLPAFACLSFSSPRFSGHNSCSSWFWAFFFFSSFARFSSFCFTFSAAVRGMSSILSPEQLSCFRLPPRSGDLALYRSCCLFSLLPRCCTHPLALACFRLLAFPLARLQAASLRPSLYAAYPDG